ncbi:N-6 DNA methylase [Agrococcus terreus]|uniref:Eco57I restriction-modification methylase domain-containing protein n=1 Tax=Agrococcus terreus TaxID=574649 RepID=UPI00384CA2F8
MELDFERLYAPQRTGLGFTLPSEHRGIRSAWALIGEWLVSYAVGQHDGHASLADAHDWFWGGEESSRLGPAVADVVMPGAITSSREVHALLPYLLDPASVATRRSVIRDRVAPHERVARKKSGAYYTPGDVAAHMVGHLLMPASTRPTTWIDPAQGSGVFLRAALALSPDHEAAREALYGVDIDPFAAEATAFVLTAEDLLLCPDGAAPYERWHRFRRNLATGNSLFLGQIAGGLLGAKGPWRITEAFPEVLDGKFSRVVANPPYIKLPNHPANARLHEIHPVTGSLASADVSPIFVELALSLLADLGSLSVVMPLSPVVSSRSPFPQLRSHLARSDGRVSFECFDRVPDALFGDDIKTRNAIITVTRGTASALTTTPLRRWTSRRRSLAFEAESTVDVSDLPQVPLLLPKIGTTWEHALYKTCFAHPARLANWVLRRQAVPLTRARSVDNSHWSRMVALAPTAYNFLGLTRDATQADSDGHDSENPVALLSFGSAREASAAYALLASRLGFWLWHVTGDGFHTTAKLPSYVPAPTDGETIERLANLGEELWASARTRPLVSVNRGKRTVSYPTWIFGEVIDQIDGAVDIMLGTDAAGRLAEWHERLVVVDHESERIEKVKRKIG